MDAMSRSIDVVRLSGDEYDRLMDEREILRQEAARAWREVDAIARERDDHHRWRKELADDLSEVEKVRDVLSVQVNKLDAVRRAAQSLCDDAEEYDCDGLGLFAQHGAWEPLHDALEQIDNEDQVIDTTNGGTECAECHAKNGTVCEDLDCPGRRERVA
jgi:hypothetical protein